MLKIVARFGMRVSPCVYRGEKCRRHSRAGEENLGGFVLQHPEQQFAALDADRVAHAGEHEYRYYQRKAGIEKESRRRTHGKSEM